MAISKITPVIQKLAKNISQNEQLRNRINNKFLPIGETAIAPGAYSFFIEHNDKLEKERKPALQYQNIICGLAGILVASKVNDIIYKHQEKIIEVLKNNKNIHRPDKIINGLKIAMPVVIFTSVVRFLIPVIATPISSKINEIKKYIFNYEEYLDKNKK